MRDGFTRSCYSLKDKSTQLYEVCLDVTLEQGILGRPEHDSDEGRKVKVVHFSEEHRESHYHS